MIVTVTMTVTAMMSAVDVGEEEGKHYSADGCDDDGEDDDNDDNDDGDSASVR